MVATIFVERIVTGTYPDEARAHPATTQTGWRSKNNALSERPAQFRLTLAGRKGLLRPGLRWSGEVRGEWTPAGESVSEYVVLVPSFSHPSRPRS